MKRTRALVLTLAAACGGKSEDDKPVKRDAGSAVALPAPIAVPTSGVDTVARMNYQWGSAGSRDYGKALIACCSKGKPRDWAATKTFAEAALAKDTHHIGARWLLGVALAQSEPASAVEPLVSAIASDWGAFAPQLTDDKALEAFLATAHGASVRELATKIGDDYRKRATTGLLVVARRSAFRWPDKPGVQGSTSRGEVYAYDRETRRFLRMTHTDHSVAGFVRSPSGGELAVLGFDRIAPRSQDAPAMIQRGFAYLIDLRAGWKRGPRVAIEGPARELAIGYGPGDQPLVATPTVLSIDRTTGKTTKIATELPSPRIVLALDDSYVVRVSDGVKAQWSGDPVVAPTLDVGGKPIAVPLSHAALQSTVALGSSHLAFATAVDPCAKDTAPSLYVADAKTGALKHVLTAVSRFATRWQTPTLLAYEDGDTTVRLWDSVAQREIGKLENKAGLALDVLSLAPGRSCKGGAGSPVLGLEPTGGSGSAGSGSGSDELPPEEP